MMTIDIITLFPEFFEQFVQTSIIKKAILKGFVQVRFVPLRFFSQDKNKRVDDYPTGGGAGLIIQCQPIIDAINSVKTPQSKVYLLSASGKKYTQNMAKQLSLESHIILICGHYEGVDARVLNYVDGEICIGDYILTGGEIAAMAVADSIIRLVDGVISSPSIEEESFENGLLEYPQYTFPREYQNHKIPDILFSGNHQAIAEWRFKQSYLKTLQNRPDLLKEKQFNQKEQQLIQELEDDSKQQIAIEKAKKFMK